MEATPSSETWDSVVAALPIPAAIIDVDGTVRASNTSYRSVCGDRPPPEDQSDAWSMQPLDATTQLVTSRASTAHDLLRRFYASADDLFAVYDAQGRIIEANAAWERLLGVSRRELIGADSWSLVASEDLITRPVVERELRESGRSIPSWRMLHRDGSHHIVHWSLHFDPHLLQCFAIGRDASADERRRDELHRRAYTDALTGLANRTRLIADLDGRLRRGETPAVLFFDLDHFKVINDSLGHAAGDSLLRSLADRLCTVLEPRGCLLGRLGGDEFAVVVPHGGRNEAVAIAEAISHSVKRPFLHDDHRLHVSMSIGVSLIDPDDPQTPDELLAQADLAAYAAKEGGRGQHVVFGDVLARRMQRRFSIEALLRSALDEGRMQAWYQPVVRLDDQTIIGAEALVRIVDQNGTVTGPTDFLDVAIDAGLMPQIGRVVIAQTLDLAMTLDMADFTLGFNVSTPELYRNEFADWLIGEVSRRGLQPSAFLIEITESVALASNRAVDILHRLHETGFRIALDDFGVGHSSLSHLRTLPIDAIKIDRSFVADILSDPTTEAISRYLIGLSKDMGLSVIPEGIETPEQAAALAAIGATRGQGWFFHPALSRQELLAARRGDDRSTRSAPSRVS